MLGADEYTHIVYTDPASDIKVTDTQIYLSSKNGGEFFVVTGNLSEEISGLKALSQISVGVIAHNAAGNSNMSPVVTTGVL